MRKTSATNSRNCRNNKESVGRLAAWVVDAHGSDADAGIKAVIAGVGVRVGRVSLPMDADLNTPGCE
jgi:hypothetical protein